MPTYEEINQARNKAYLSAGQAGSAATRSGSVEAELKDKLNEAYNYNQDIVKPLDEATSSYLTAPQDARVKFENIFNPFQREQLVSQYTQNQAKPMLSLASILGQRQGSLADTVTAGGNVYNQYAQNLQNQAILDRQIYQDMLNEFQSDRNYQLDLEKIAMDKTKADQDNGIDFSKILQIANFGKPSATQSTEALKASEALSAIKVLTDADKDDLRKAAQIANGGFFGAIASIGANSKVMEASRAMDTLRNILRLQFTGAGFSPTELSTYSRLTGSDPYQAFINPTYSAEAAADLTKYFQPIVEAGQNPYQYLMDYMVPRNTGNMGFERPSLESFEESY